MTDEEVEPFIGQTVTATIQDTLFHGILTGRLDVKYYSNDKIYSITTKAQEEYHFTAKCLECIVLLSSDNDANCQAGDMVNHPSHYTSGKYEVIEVIKDKLSPEQFEGYCIGNVMKYIMRYQNKNGLEDLQKGMWYLNYIIEKLKEEKA